MNYSLRGEKESDERNPRVFAGMGATAGRGFSLGRPADGEQLAGGGCDSPHSHRRGIVRAGCDEAEGLKEF